MRKLKIYLGQIYLDCGIEEREGKLLRRWRSRCADCGKSFSLGTSAAEGAKFAPNRRCSDCRKPGIKVQDICIDVELADNEPVI